MKKLLYIFCLLACFVSCQDDVFINGDVAGEIGIGEEVLFTTSIPKPGAATRALNSDLLGSYNTIADDYELTIRMLKGNAEQVGSPTLYIPESTTVGTTVTYDADGTLKPKTDASVLRWESNNTKYAFEAKAGTDAIESDQSTPANWLLQDRLHGYAFSPFEPENGEAADRIDAPNYHTSKEWYQLNKAWHDAEGLMVDPNDKKASDNYKKIPLFLQHERAWITVILKAGKGVKREAVAALYNEREKTYNPNAKVYFVNYHADPALTPDTIKQPLVGSAKVHYEEDVNGGVADSINLKFDAIVEPHNFLENPKDDKIAAINLSNLHFSFYASNDVRFSSAIPEEVAAMQAAYNLEAGKHLTIEATLSTNRIVFITAWIEDWTEVVTSTICDDYGQNGDPTVIKSRAELIDFLSDADLNRAGNVAIIAATELDLDKLVTPGATEGAEPTITDDPWTNYSGFTLNATLNLAGASLKSSGRLVQEISSTGNLLHGTIVMNHTMALPSAIAETNKGTIDNINLLVGNTEASATRASFVEVNHGYIMNCSSSLPVIRTRDENEITYIGGIAAQSIAPDQSTSPTIDHCTMYACVKGGDNVRGGGIVGLGEGRLTNNTFDYGITLSQNPENFKNIIHTKDTSGDLNTLTVGNNAWPTQAENPDAGTNASSAKYNNVLDCQEELATLLTDTYNKMDNKYRIANDFTVLAESWDHAQETEDITSRTGVCAGNLYCELDGNGKTITLDGTTKVSIPTKYDDEGKGSVFEEKETVHMLFSNITGYVHDMTLELKKPLIAKPALNADGKYNSTEAIAALAYSVRQPETLGSAGTSGDYGVVRNVKVKMKEGDSYVQGATAAGLVCWVHHNGVVDNCQVKGSVLSWTPKNSGEGGTSDAKRYVGGIVACAAQATIKNSTYYFYSSQPTLDIADGSGKMQTYYGGILGGTSVKEISGNREEPKVSIVDCASWYQVTFDVNKPDGLAAQKQHGAILGFSQYTKDANNYVGTATEGEPGECQGNWWQADMDGVAQNGLLNGYTVVTTIGKRNAVTPSQENF